MGLHQYPMRVLYGYICVSYRRLNSFIVISFKNFLAEARLAPLYHGTEITNAASILQDNTINMPTYGSSMHPGKTGKIISLTRDLNFAMKWTQNEGVAFELDQQRLNMDYKIQPFNYFKTGGTRQALRVGSRYNFDNQSEESVADRPIKNINRYITKIIIANKNRISYAKSRIKDFELLHSQSAKERIEGMKLLINHPLLYSLADKEFVNK